MKSLLIKSMLCLALGAAVAIFVGLWFSPEIDAAIASAFRVDLR